MLAMDENHHADSMNAALLSWAQGLAPHGLFTTDSDLRIQNWNGWMELQTGLSAEKVRHRSLFEVFPELLERKLNEYFERALKGEASMLSASFHGCLLRMPSTYREANLPHMLQTARISPLMLEGVICGTITTIEDVTQREHQTAVLRRQGEKDELLSWSLAHLLQVRDPETVLRELFSRVATFLKADIYLCYLVPANSPDPVVQSAAGLSPEQQAMLERAHCVLPRPGAGLPEPKPFALSSLDSSVDPHLAGLQELGLRSYMCSPLVVGGRVFGSLCLGSREKDQFSPEEIDLTASIAQHVAISLDRSKRETELREAQEQLSRHADELERQVADRTVALEETIKELESFTYSVAHDLRAPIRSFQGYTQMLLEDHASHLPQDAVVLVERIQRSAQRMDTLTKDLLRYSRVSRETVKLAPTSVEDLLHESLIGLRAHFGTDCITIQSPLHAVMAEPVLLQQCLANLVENAAKFVQPGRPPRVQVRTELIENCSPQAHSQPVPYTLHAAFHPVHSYPSAPEPQNPRSSKAPSACVRIWVEDKGIGIAPEYQKKIFGLFERVGDVSTYQGTGIGLAIVAKATQRMGGSCGVESTPGEGSRFWIELLAAPQEQ